MRSAWCRFGNEGRVRDNDPAEQEKQVKFSALLTNAVIFRTTLGMTTVLRQFAAEGWEIKPEDLAILNCATRPSSTWPPTAVPPPTSGPSPATSTTSGSASRPPPAG